MTRNCDSLHIILANLRFHGYADMCVKQKFQHRVPNTVLVLVILIGFRRRERGRGVRDVDCQLENEEATYAPTEPEKRNHM